MFTPERGPTTRLTPSGRQSLSIISRTPRSIPKSDVKLRRVLQETDHHRLERVEWTVPVRIQEAIFQFPDADVSCRWCENGFLCVITGGKLLVWHVDEAETSTDCLEFMLPSSAGIATANLADVSVTGSTVNVLVSSPSGLVYFIANANHPNHVATSALIPLSDGQLITNVTTGKRSDIYMSTDNGMVYAVTCNLRGQQLELNCRRLEQSHSMLAGLGRRFSSLFFGGSSTEQQSSGSVLDMSTILLPECELLYIVTDEIIEVWEVSDLGDKLVCQTAVSIIIQEGARQLMTGSSLSEVTQVYPLSVLAVNGGVLLLSAYTTQSHISYMLIELNGYLSVQGAVSVHCRHKYTPAEIDNLLSYKLVSLPDDKVVSYNQHIVWSQLGSSRLMDRLEITSDSIIAAGISGGQFVLLTQSHGMLAVVEKLQPDPNITIEQGHRQPLSAAKRKKSVESTGSLSEQLRTLFVLHCQSEENMALSTFNVSNGFLDGQLVRALAESLLHCQPLDECLKLSNELLASLPVDVASSELDHAVFDLSLQLINDLPSSDPRWAEHNASDLLVSSSVIILDSLQSKFQAHSIFVQFLADMGFTSRLGTVRVDGRHLATVFALCEHQEKLLAAISLRKQHTLNPLVIDDAIRHTVQLQAANLRSGLTAIDLFYKEVSSMQAIVRSLVMSEEALLVPDLSDDESLEIIELVNKTLELMVCSAIQHRQAQCHVLGVDSLSRQVAAHLNADCHYWTDTDGIDGVRTILAKQLNIVYDKADALPNGLQLLQSLRGLVDILLNTFTLQLEMHRKLDLSEAASEEVSQRFSRYRSMAIKPFVAHGLSETATVLSERYYDFSTLIQLCESEHDEARLQSYGEQFERDGFTQFLFKYYMDQGQLGKLLCQPLSRHSALTEFLRTHPHLSWLHHIQTGSFSEAHEVLTDLADHESGEVNRKRTLLCLSKLSLLASDEATEEQEQEIQRLNDKLDIILHQEQLPSNVLQAGNIDPEKQPPLTVEELIEFYTSTELNPSASESDFKKALDLVKYTDDSEVDQEQLTLLIWCKAILRDSWRELEGVEPAESLRETLFFRIIKIAFSEGVDLKDFIPSLDSLLDCDELKASGHADDRHFMYLMKMGYEQLDLEESQPLQ